MTTKTQEKVQKPEPVKKDAEERVSMSKSEFDRLVQRLTENITSAVQNQVDAGKMNGKAEAVSELSKKMNSASIVYQRRNYSKPEPGTRASDHIVGQFPIGDCFHASVGDFGGDTPSSLRLHIFYNMLKSLGTKKSYRPQRATMIPAIVFTSIVDAVVNATLSRIGMEKSDLPNAELDLKTEENGVSVPDILQGCHLLKVWMTEAGII